MKKLLVGLLALGSISSYATSFCYYTKSFNDNVKEILLGKGYIHVSNYDEANVKFNVFSRDLKIGRDKQSIFLDRFVDAVVLGRKLEITLNSIENENVSVSSSSAYLALKSLKVIKESYKADDISFESEEERRAYLKQIKISKNEAISVINKKHRDALISAVKKLTPCESFLN